MHGSTARLGQLEDLLDGPHTLPSDELLVLCDELCSYPTPYHGDSPSSVAAVSWRAVHRLVLAASDAATLAELDARLSSWGLLDSDLSSLLRVSQHCTVELLGRFPAYVAAHWCLRWLTTASDDLEPALGRGGARLLIAATSPRSALAALLDLDPAADSLDRFVEHACALRGALPDGWALLLAATHRDVDDPGVVLSVMRAHPDLVHPAAVVCSAAGVTPLEALDAARACVG